MSFQTNYSPTLKVTAPIETGQTLTQQHFRDECDVNRIMKQWIATGTIEHIARTEGVYGDFTNVGDYQDAQNRIVEAKINFLALPLPIRKRMNHDPEKLIAFLSDEDNHDEAVELGILAPPAEAHPDQVEPDSGGNPDPAPPAEPPENTPDQSLS